MLDSDDNDFYIGDHTIIDQEEQSIEIGKNEILENSVPSQSKMKFKLLKIENRRGYPNFHFEIDGKSYFYGIAGIRANYKIVLRCTKKVFGSNCDNRSTILPLDFLKQIIQNSPKMSQYSKILDKSDPRVYDLKNYDVNSFDIGDGHKCSGTEINILSKSNNKPEIEINEVKCKLVKISNRRRHPYLHFEINGKMYFYGIRGVKPDYKIVLRCHEKISDSTCNNLSSIRPSDFLKQIIRNNKNKIKCKYAKIFDTSDPRVYDMKNYDINSFEIGKGHKCPGIERDVYLKLNDKPESRANPVKYKLVKIANNRGYPNFHFEINGEIYFYGLRGIRADFNLILYCTKKCAKNASTIPSETGKSKRCYTRSYISPSECLKQIIQDTPKYSQYPKFFDKSDSRVYDIKNYDINSFEIDGTHNHPGTELDIYSKSNNIPEISVMLPKKKNVAVSH
jgi:hypothetical protein